MVYNQKLNHTEADKECQLRHGLLAKIRTTEDLLLAKNISNTTNGIKHWIGLGYSRQVTIVNCVIFCEH